MNIRCLQYSWEEINELCKNLAKKIKNSGFNPDVVVAVARGGWVPARLICDHLDIKELYSVKTEHWGVAASTTCEARITQPLNVDLRGKKVLVVDDVADTGDTVRIVVEHVMSFSPKELKVAVIDYKKTSSLIPDFYASFMEDWRWIVYPWSIKEDLKDLLKKAEIRDLKRAVEYLRGLDLNVSEELVREIIEDC